MEINFCATNHLSGKDGSHSRQIHFIPTIYAVWNRGMYVSRIKHKREHDVFIEDKLSLIIIGVVFFFIEFSIEIDFHEKE
jgi:lipoprotein signal peptidase